MSQLLLRPNVISLTLLLMLSLCPGHCCGLWFGRGVGGLIDVCYGLT